MLTFKWAAMLLLAAGATACEGRDYEVPDVVQGRVEQASSHQPVAGASVEVEICTRGPIGGSLGPEGTSHRTIWAKQQAVSLQDGSFEIDLRPWKQELIGGARTLARLSVYTVGAKASGFDDQRVSFEGGRVLVAMTPGSKTEVVRTRLCH